MAIEDFTHKELWALSKIAREDLEKSEKENKKLKRELKKAEKDRDEYKSRCDDLEAELVVIL